MPLGEYESVFAENQSEAYHLIPSLVWKTDSYLSTSHR